MPELPRVKRARFTRDLGMTPYAAQVLSQHPRIAAFFEEAVTLHGDPVKVGNFVQSEVLRDVTTHGLSADIPVTARQLAELLKLTQSGAISGKQAKEVFAKIARTSAMPADVVRELGMAQVIDEDAIVRACQKVLDANPKQVDGYRRGKTGLFGFFVGQVMKETRGSASPALVNATLQRLLSSASS